MAQSNVRPAPACCVCRAPAALPFMEMEGRSYWKCPRCEARFLDPAQRPAPADEHAEYLRHQNDVEDEGYRRFLSKLAGPLNARLKPGASGLDYGCGPGPALAAMLRRRAMRWRSMIPSSRRTPRLYPAPMIL